MKSVTLAEMQTIAEINGGKLEENFDNGYPAIIFTFPMFSGQEDYGIEATEEYEGEYYGFKFFGHSRYQERNHIIKTFEALTVPAIVGDLLTIERAKELMGKKIEVSYHDYNEGTERFGIIDIEERNSNSIGQNKELVLVTMPIIDEEGNPPLGWISERIFYEWQGIFRRGSSAERLFIEKILQNGESFIDETK